MCKLWLGPLMNGELMRADELKEGMKIIDTDDGMIMEYHRGEKTDYLCTKELQWGVCQFDMSHFEKYDGDLEAGQFEKKKR